MSSLNKTTSAAANRLLRGACAAMMASTSCCVRPLRCMTRAICVEVGQSTTRMLSTLGRQWADSTNKGISTTMHLACFAMHSSIDWCIAVCTRGCTMLSSVLRSDGSWKISCRIIGRSSAPLLLITWGPNARAIGWIAAPPAAVTEREMASASMQSAPCLANSAATVDFPLPIPPSAQCNC